MNNVNGLSIVDDKGLEEESIWFLGSVYSEWEILTNSLTMELDFC